MELKDIKIAGSGVVPMGEYANVSCSGSARMTGAVKCQRLSASGSLSAESRLDCIALSCSGSAKLAGQIKCESMQVSGSVKAQEAITCTEKCRISGSLHAEKSVTTDNLACAGSVWIGEHLQTKQLRVAGSLSVARDCAAEKFISAGTLKIEGLLNAETAQIELNRSGNDSYVGSIGGGKFIISRKPSHHPLAIFFRRKWTKLCTELIEADIVELENTHAKTVRVCDAIIGAGCNIETLEYSGNITIHPKAQVKKTIKRS